MSTHLRRDKEEIRRQIWNHMEKQNIARFPRPVFGRIPNFIGADEAAAKLRSMSKYQKAKVLKVNPDSPQRAVREMALGDCKKVVMPTPRLREGFLLLDPERIAGKMYRKASTIKGAFWLGKRTHPSELSKVDLVVCGAVAISLNGVRIGKGSGYGEFEFAILREFNKVGENTPIIAVVHDVQVIQEELRPEPYDLAAD